MNSANGPGGKLSDCTEFLERCEWEKAIRCCKKALELDPKLAVAWGARGFALSQLGRNEEALASYDKALDIDPKLSLAWGTRGFTLSELGRNEEALASYDKALEIDQKLAVAWSSRGLALSRLGGHEEALTSYDKALELDPRLAGVWSNRGNALSELGRHEEALASYDKALELDPKLAAAWYNRGIESTTTGQLSKAEKSYRSYLKLNSGDAKGWNAFGSIWLERRKHRKALLAFKKASQLERGKDANYEYNTAVAMQRLGRKREAIGKLTDIARIHPEHVEAKEALEELQAASPAWWWDWWFAAAGPRRLIGSCLLALLLVYFVVPLIGDWVSLGSAWPINTGKPFQYYLLPVLGILLLLLFPNIRALGKEGIEIGPAKTFKLERLLSPLEEGQLQSEVRREFPVYGGASLEGHLSGSGRDTPREAGPPGDAD